MEAKAGAQPLSESTSASKDSALLLPDTPDERDLPAQTQSKRSKRDDLESLACEVRETPVCLRPIQLVAEEVAPKRPTPVVESLPLPFNIANRERQNVQDTGRSEGTIRCQSCALF